MIRKRPSLQKILLIDPNTSGATTAMMVAIARSCVPDDIVVIGATATRNFAAPLVSPCFRVVGMPTGSCRTGRENAC